MNGFEDSMTRNLRRRSTRACALALLVTAACSESGTRSIEQRRTFQPDEAIRFGVDTAERLGFQPRTPPPGALQFEWDLPDGWADLPPAPIRDVNFRVREHQDVDCYLSMVAGGLGPNVNRWRGQMGQPPLSGPELQTLEIKPFLGQAQAKAVQLEGNYAGMGGAVAEDYLLAALILDAPESVNGTVTLKMVGPAAKVRPELDAFWALGASFRIKGPGVADPHGSMPTQGGGAMPGGAAPSVPTGWRPAPATQMVDAMFDVGTKTRCWVSRLAMGAGGEDANIARWRGEMGGAEVQGRRTIRIQGQPALYLELFGSYRGGRLVPAIQDAGMLTVMCSLGQETVFVKMVGPADEVRAHRDEFLQFCSDL